MGPKNYQPILNQWPNPVKEETNKHLMANITLEKVKDAVFQLCSLKALGPDRLNGLFLSIVLGGHQAGFVPACAELL